MPSMEDNVRMALGDLLLGNIQARTQIEALSEALKAAQDELLKLKPAEPDQPKTPE